MLRPPGGEAIKSLACKSANLNAVPVSTPNPAMEQEKVLRGSCLCGRITYAIHEDVEMVSHCHCPTCRKAHAAAFASAVTVKAEVLELTSSRALLKYFDSSAGKRLYFCPNCGSHIYARINNSDSCMVYVGTLDMELPPRPSRHVFTRHRALWYNSQDMVPEYEERPEEASVNTPEAAGANLSAQISAALYAALRRGTMTSLLLLEIDRSTAYRGNSGEENVEDIIVAVTAAITKNIRRRIPPLFMAIAALPCCFPIQTPQPPP